MRFFIDNIEIDTSSSPVIVYFEDSDKEMIVNMLSTDNMMAVGEWSTPDEVQNIQESLKQIRQLLNKEKVDNE